MNSPTIPAGSIVVGVDGSEHADLALRWAADVAHVERRPLIVAHAVQLASVVTAGYGVDVRMLDIDLHAAGSELVAHKARLLRLRYPELDVQPLCTPGDARELLVELSRQAHLVVVGSRGRGHVRGLLLGSVSSTVVRRASAPVVVVHTQADDAQRSGVVVGIDDTASARQTLEFAFEAASWRGEPLTVLHTYWGGLVPDELGLDSPALSNLAVEQRAISEALAGLRDKYPDVQVDVRFEQGVPEKHLIEASHESSLVVVGGTPHGAIVDAVLGSVTTTVAEHATCPVAVVPRTTH